MDEGGAWVAVDPAYEWPTLDELFLERGLHYMASSSRSMLDTLAGTSAAPLYVSGHDLRQALEVATAVDLSARRGAAPVALPLADRATTFYPRAYRWAGGDASGSPQTVAEAAGTAPKL
jgi:hypothetical protein